MNEVLGIKAAQSSIDRNKIIGVANERAKSAADIASDIPDIF